MRNQKGFTLIEMIIVIAIVVIIASMAFGTLRSDEDRFESCYKDSTFIPEEERQDYCINKMTEEDRNRAIMYSED